MKKKSLIAIVFFISIGFLLSNCSGSKKEAHDDTEKTEHEGHATNTTDASTLTAGEPQFQVDSKFQEQLAGVFTAYVELKDAFVSSDAAKVKTEASEAMAALTSVDMKLLTGAAHNDWMNYVTPLQKSLEEIESSTDIEAQRKLFSTVSDNLYKSVKAFGLGGQEAFYEYCPMAFNNEGAYWLSDNDQIRNPYFGNKMLTCGEVKEKLK